MIRGWAHATLLGLAIAVAGFALLVYVPNLVVTRLTSLSGGLRQMIAVAWFLVAFVGLAWTMRRLQGRGVI